MGYLSIFSLSNALASLSQQLSKWQFWLPGLVDRMPLYNYWKAEFKKKLYWWRRDRNTYYYTKHIYFTVGLK